MEAALLSVVWRAWQIPFLRDLSWVGAAGMDWLGSVSTGLYVIALVGVSGAALWTMRRRRVEPEVAA